MVNQLGRQSTLRQHSSPSYNSGGATKTFITNAYHAAADYWGRRPHIDELKSKTSLNVLEDRDVSKGTNLPYYSGIGYKSTWNWNFCSYDCRDVDTFLETKTGHLWLFPKFLNAFLRGVSQVVIANNPLSGLLILIGIYCSSLSVGVITSISAAVAVLTAWCIGQDESSIQNGLTTYNAVLVGTATSTLWTAVYGAPITPKVWGLVLIGSVLSVFVNSGLGSILKHWGLVPLTLPFNIVAILLFTDFKPPPDSGLSLNTTTWLNLNSPLIQHSQENVFQQSYVDYEKYTDLDFIKVLGGIVYSIGQVYAVQTFPGSIFMYIGVFIYSPIMCMMCVVGATVGTLTGLLFITQDPYTTVYTGIWGYNGVLAAVALGGYFFPLNRYSILTAVIDVVFAILIQQALILAFQDLRIPVFTLPFVLSTLLFLSVKSKEDYLPRVTNFSYPEKHLTEYLENLKQKRMNQTHDNSNMN